MFIESVDSNTREIPADPAWLAVLKNHVETLRFGTVQVVVHEARVVQIERTEKVRFDKPGTGSSDSPKRSID